MHVAQLDYSVDDTVEIFVMWYHNYFTSNLEIPRIKWQATICRTSSGYTIFSSLPIVLWTAVPFTIFICNQRAKRSRINRNFFLQIQKNPDVFAGTDCYFYPGINNELKVSTFDIPNNYYRYVRKFLLHDQCQATSTNFSMLF